MRKHKSSMITLFILIFLASMLLCTGLTVSMGINHFFDEKLEELKGGHASYYVNTSEMDNFVEEVNTFDGIEAFEKVEVLLANGVTIPFGDQKVGGNFYVENMDKPHEVAPLIPIDESQEVKNKESVMIPLVFRDSYGYKTGDTIEMEFNGKTHTYRIHGFFEDVYYGSPMMGYYRMFLTEEGYKDLEKELPQGSGDGRLILIRLEEPRESKALGEHITRSLDKVETNGMIFGVDLELAKTGSTTAINILGMVVVGFSLIMVIVTLIVVVFSLTSAIEGGIEAIGILKALGYKNNQILGAWVLQYGILGLLAGILGIFSTLFLLPAIGDIAAGTAGLLWNLTPNPMGMLVSLLIIVGLIILVAVASGRKIKKITPIIALRNGVRTHNFKRNVFPLEKSSLNVNISMVLKSIFGNIKQNLAILIIVIGLTFAGVFSLQLYSNLVEDKEAFNNMMGFPLADLWFTAMGEPESNEIIFDEIKNMKEVEEITKYEQFLIRFEDLNSVGLFVRDSEKEFNKENDKKTLIEGRFPKYENEVVIASILAKRFEKKLGDMITISLKGKTEEFLITGLTEQMSQLGLVIDMTEKGYQRFDPKYQINGILINLKEGTDIEAFTKKLEDQYSDTQKSIMDIKLLLDNSTTSLSSGVLIMMIGILGMMVLVITLILYLIIKMKLLKEKTNLGIFKATGFTTPQLVFQTAISLTLIIGVGAILGGISGALWTNSVINLLFSSMGISNASFSTNVSYILILVFGTTLYAFVISVLVAGRIRKITSYHLFTDN